MFWDFDDRLSCVFARVCELAEKQKEMFCGDCLAFVGLHYAFRRFEDRCVTKLTWALCAAFVTKLASYLSTYVGYCHVLVLIIS